MRPWIVSSASAINVSISSCTEGMSSIRPTHCPADQMPGRVKGGVEVSSRGSPRLMIRLPRASYDGY